MNFLNNYILTNVVNAIVLMLGGFLCYYMYTNNLFVGMYIFVFFIMFLAFDIYIYKKRTYINIAENTKTEADQLADTLLKDIVQNLDHELKTPLLALTQATKIEKELIDSIIKLGKKDGKRALDKIIYGCKGNVDNEQDFTKNHCSNCPLLQNGLCSGGESGFQKTYNYVKTSIDKAIKNIYSTLEILKDLKANKDIVNNKKISVYDLIEKSLKMFTLLNKYNFKYDIDEELKHYYLINDFKYNNVFINIINNLTQNSLDANSSLIKFKFNKYEKDRLHMYIVDNGDGIPENIVEHMFELGKSSKGPNRGFGMYFIHQVVTNLLKGSLKVAKTNNKGTIFDISFLAEKK